MRPRVRALEGSSDWIDNNCPEVVEAEGGAPITRSLSLPSLQLGTAGHEKAGISRTRLCTKLSSAIAVAERGAAAQRRHGPVRVRGEARGWGRGRSLRGGAASCGLRGGLAGGPACVSAVSPGVFH